MCTRGIMRGLRMRSREGEIFLILPAGVAESPELQAALKDALRAFSPKMPIIPSLDRRFEQYTAFFLAANSKNWVRIESQKSPPLTPETLLPETVLA